MPASTFATPAGDVSSGGSGASGGLFFALSMMARMRASAGVSVADAGGGVMAERGIAGTGPDEDPLSQATSTKRRTAWKVVPDTAPDG
jgi:hypothetical protein